MNFYSLSNYPLDNKIVVVVRAFVAHIHNHPTNFFVANLMAYSYDRKVVVGNENVVAVDNQIDYVVDVDNQVVEHLNMMLIVGFVVVVVGGGGGGGDGGVMASSFRKIR
ncbi:unnamed protein product [Rotaria sp. Silwood1]|nr:unnamed protein product [Rotaria sp. Silwood1]CAF4783253.1 unnamed protein product [Rotaria sp. Silwood1]